MKHAECEIREGGRSITTLHRDRLPPECGVYGVANAALGYTLWFKTPELRDKFGRIKLWSLHCVWHNLFNQAGDPKAIPDDFEVISVDRPASPE